MNFSFVYPNLKIIVANDLSIYAEIIKKSFIQKEGNNSSIEVSLVYFCHCYHQGFHYPPVALHHQHL